MKTIIEAFLKTLELLVEIAFSTTQDVYNKIQKKARVYLKALAISTFSCLALILIFALLKAYTGIALFAYIAFLFMAIFALLLGTLGLPIGTVIAMLKGHTIDPKIAGKKYIRFVGILFFIELMITIYLIRVPMHQNKESILPFLMCALAVAVGSAIWGGFFSGRFYVFIAMMIMFSITFSFFAPETFAEISDGLSGIDKEIASFIRSGHRPSSDKIYSSTKITGQKGYNGKVAIVNYVTGKWSEITFLKECKFFLIATSDIQIRLNNGTINVYKGGEYCNSGKSMSGSIWIRGDSTPGTIAVFVE